MYTEGTVFIKPTVAHLEFMMITINIPKAPQTPNSTTTAEWTG